MSLSASLFRYMTSRNYKLSKKAGEINIVYVEGLNPDGTVNDDLPDQFNDLRLVISFVDGEPRLVGGPWESTTEPGKYYTDNPMVRDGAARIAFGQYASWRVGFHKPQHEGLIQVGGKVTVYRDYNRDYERTNDKPFAGYFGINQHHGYDHPLDKIGNASAGCLVGRSISSHRKFMEIVKGDPRYIKDKDFIFTTTIVDGQELVREFPINPSIS